MKKCLFLFAVILIPVCLFSQKPGQSATTMRLFENSRPLSLYGSQQGDFEIPLETIEGSPFLKEEFSRGKIYNETINSGTFLIRYNIYNDVMEVKFEKNSIQELIIDPEIKVSINNSRFRVHTYSNHYNNLVPGYFEIIEEGKYIDLLLKHRVVLSPAEPPRSGYHKPKKAEFKSSKDYYLFFKKDKNPVLIKKLKAKRVLEMFDETATAKKLIRENDLDLSKVEDLRQLVRELNNLSS